MLSRLRALFHRPASSARPAGPAKADDAAAAADNAVTPGPAVTPEAAGARPKGVDVSSFQGPPGAWTSEAGSISWAAVKLTELGPGGSRYVNPDAAADWTWLREHSKGRIGYLYGHPSVSAAETVSFFVDEIKRLGLVDRDGVALDLETTDGRSPAQVSAWANEVQAGLFHALGRSPLLYTFLSFAEDGNCAGLGHYPLWIADPSSPEGHPRVPRPWTTWAIHQYAITGPIDRDIANYASNSAMFHALGKPEGPDMKNLGGSIVGALASVRWPDGITVVAGWGTDGFIQAIRWDGKWGPWQNVSPVKAKGAPGLVAFSSNRGYLFYTDEAGNAVQLLTSNSGQTWT